jgi:hypothetical protein
MPLRFVTDFFFDPLVCPAIVVQLRVNGSQPLPFVIDTGCTLSLVLDIPTAQLLQLKPTSERVRIDPGNKTAHACAVKSITFVGRGNMDDDGGRDDEDRAGDQRIVIDKGYLLDLSRFADAYAGMPGVGRIAGIIGAPVFWRTGCTVGLDFLKKQITLSEGVEMTAADESVASPIPSRSSASASFRVPLSHVPGDYLCAVPVVFPPAVKVQALLDTGSSVSSVDPRILGKITTSGTLAWSHYDLGGDHDTKLSLVPWLSVGGVKERSFSVYHNKPTARPVLGMDYLSRFRYVTFNLHRGLLLLGRSNAYVAPLAEKGAGQIGLTLRQGRYVVTNVFSGAVAATTGIRKGDEVIQIDGRPVKGMPPIAIERLLSGFAGTPCVLTYRRPLTGTAAITGKFVRESAFATGRTGLICESTKHGLLVMGIREASPAAKAGVLIGDMIIRIDRHDLRNRTAEDLLSLSRLLGHTGSTSQNAPKLILSIKRAGFSKVINIAM